MNCIEPNKVINGCIDVRFVLTGLHRTMVLFLKQYHGSMLRIVQENQREQMKNLFWKQMRMYPILTMTISNGWISIHQVMNGNVPHVDNIILGMHCLILSPVPDAINDFRYILLPMLMMIRRYTMLYSYSLFKNGEKLSGHIKAATLKAAATQLLEGEDPVYCHGDGNRLPVTYVGAITNREIHLWKSTD